ncbi:MAG: hypothetical protein GY864_01220 [Desulfobacterales bacterium]|nr:hypothetical protein [Desulfobacterales bacterium]
MKEWPAFNDAGDLPDGIHQASLQDVIEYFGKGSVQRSIVVHRLERIYSKVIRTGHLARFIIFGSFVTNKPDPGDIDVFLIMKDSFDVRELSGETALLFDHMAAHNYEGASIFWMRRMAALDEEKAAIEHWQIKRNGKKRGIIEVIEHDTK